MKAIKTHMQNHTATETIDVLVKKIKYRDYLVKEE
jgi:tetrahydromethanopterin S-methyltransferase subunit F